jgi:5S rRNA maturation endonuclease (ribonuclease M5)
LVSGIWLQAEIGSMDIGIKERRRYRDISWLMPSVDVESVLDKLGTKLHGWSGDRAIAFCPDHHLYVNRRPSHPRWLLNTTTGETFCLTEGRGSNLVWTLCRVLECSPSEAVKLLTGQEESSEDRIKANALLGKLKNLRAAEEKPAPKAVLGLDDISKDLKCRPIGERCYSFFLHPPGKLYPTNISKETVDRYQVFERTWGYYANRAIIPFFSSGDLKGFAAVDMLGENAWRENHPLSDDYRKTLTAVHFRAGEYLFGLDDCQHRADFLIVVEGPREVMKLWQEGFPNAVATLGIRVTPTQQKLIAELAPKKIILMYDNDDSGVEAMDKMEKTLSRLHVVKKCFCPRGKDPKNLSGNEIKILFKDLNFPDGGLFS